MTINVTKMTIKRITSHFVCLMITALLTVVRDVRNIMVIESSSQNLSSILKEN